MSNNFFRHSHFVRSSLELLYNTNNIAQSLYTQTLHLLRDWIFNTEYGDFALPKPDLNIFLDVPIGFVESKLKSQRGGSDRDYLDGAQDIHEADIEFQKKVRDIYRQQCEIDSRFIRIDCSDEYGEMLPPDEIFAKVRGVVDKTFKQENTL